MDFNTLKENGIYKINNGNSTIETNMPTEAYEFGMLLVFKVFNDNENRMLQIYVSHVRPDTYIRMFNDRTWTKWMKLSATKLE